MLFLALAVDAMAAMSALYCFISGKRVRGWSRLGEIGARNPNYYHLWIESVEASRLANDKACFAKTALPSVACLILADSTDEAALATKTADSAVQALGDNTAICSLSHEPAGMTRATSFRHVVGELMATSGADWLLPLRAGDLVSPNLGSSLANALKRNPDCAIYFWDEDYVVEGRRQQPWFKPAWDERLFLACDGLSGAAVISRELVADALPQAPDGQADLTAATALMICAAGQASCGSIHSIPFILTHRGSPDGFLSAERRCELVKANWREPWHVELDDDNRQWLRVRPPDPQRWPAVSIVIPTRDRISLLDACLSSLSRLNYPGEVEILVVDNGSEEDASIRFLANLERKGWAQVLRKPGPFNFSSLNNRAVECAKGELVCLLNNDIQAFDGQWLTEMARHASCENVGAVGAMLLYPDGTVQHAGVAVGIGGAAGHVERGVSPYDPAFHPWHGVTRRLTAVTAACLLVKRQDYLRVGGMDEANFAVAFNDVDFCLKLGKAGLRNVFVAEARLIHHESKSRGSDYAADQVERFRKELSILRERWKTASYEDPFLNPNFSRVSERCLLLF